MLKNSINKISSFLLGGIFLSSQITAQLAPPQDKFNYALELIKYAYVDTVDSKRLTEDALRAMVKDLDPHSVYIPVEEMREMNEPLVGKFEGIGVQFNINYNKDYQTDCHLTIIMQMIQVKLTTSEMNQK